MSGLVRKFETIIPYHENLDKNLKIVPHDGVEIEWYQDPVSLNIHVKKKDQKEDV